MPKSYWVSVYRTISDPEKPAAYNKLARPAVQLGAGGSSSVAVGSPHTTPESPSAPS